jgi:processive 1,2-diacylglycerol beta-glucosyltransferase
MGDGHNTAARNIRNAISLVVDRSAEVLVVDPYTRTNPVVNNLMQRGYSIAINHYPTLWKLAFSMLNRPAVIEGMSPLFSQLNNAVRDLIREFKPDVIASTFPVFGHVLQKINASSASPPVPFFMVITDSTMISKSWYHYPCDGAIVTDEPTADVLRRDGVPEEKIHTLGFPVDLEYEDFMPAPPPRAGTWNLLFFPGGPQDRAIETLELLASLDGVSITVITGRRKATHAALTKARLPHRGNLIGWTDKMPELMGSHHIFIGKAGGATVQEAIAAQIPFVVSHIVPGQEEGNIALIQQSAIGALASQSPMHVLNLVKGAMANDAALWRTWRKNLLHMQKTSAARKIAELLINRAGQR